VDGRDALLGHTVKNRRIELGYFIDWCEERSVRRPDEVTRALLERYRQHVFHYRRKDTGTPLSFQTQHKRLISVRMFFQWLTRQYHLLFNPASELELPRTAQRLPRHVLSADVGYRAAKPSTVVGSPLIPGRGVRVPSC
jgi:integrase/recombinase XerD